MERRARAMLGPLFVTGKMEGHPWPLAYAPRWSADHYPWVISVQMDQTHTSDIRYANHEIEEKP